MRHLRIHLADDMPQRHATHCLEEIELLKWLREDAISNGTKMLKELIIRPIRMHFGHRDDHLCYLVHLVEGAKNGSIPARRYQELVVSTLRLYAHWS
jgi:hypothetical protein